MEPTKLQKIYAERLNRLYKQGKINNLSVYIQKGLITEKQAEQITQQ